MRFAVVIGNVPASRCDDPGDGGLKHILGHVVPLKDDDDTIVILSIGDPCMKNILKCFLNHGADEAFLLHDKAFIGSDEWATARIFDAFMKKYEIDMMFFGPDSDQYVPAVLAGMMDTEQFYYVTDVIKKDEEMEITQDYGDETRISRSAGKSVVLFSKEMQLTTANVDNDNVVELDRVALGLGLYSVGTKGSKTMTKGAEGQ